MKNQSTPTIKAIFWDFGGVLTTGPFGAFKRFELENNLPPDFIRRVNATDPDTNAWARLERGEIDLEEFDRAFEAETRRAGHPIGGLRILGLIAGDLRPEMVDVLRRCKPHFINACLTNNIGAGDRGGFGPAGERAAQYQKIMALFNFVLESSKAGVRKPDPRFYEMACKMAAVEPRQAVFLDDLGINLKPARAMGMTTIKVADPGTAIRELQSVVGIDLSR